MKVLYLVVQQKRRGGGIITGRVYGWVKALNALILAYQRCLRASARPSRDGPPRQDAGKPLSCSSAGFSRSRHSDEADHHSRQYTQDQTVIGNRADVYRPDHRRYE